MSIEVAVVTGAGRGIGAAIARQLARDGFTVAALDVHEESAAATAAAIRQDGGQAQGFAVNVADLDAVGQLIAATPLFADAAVLVNNAGVSPKKNGQKVPVWELDTGEWRWVLDVNLSGPFYLCKFLVPSMQRRGWGRIVNIASVAARNGGLYASSHYVASKAGIIGLTRSLARDLGQYGVTSNAIAPGRVRTEMIGDVPAAANEAHLTGVPVGRIGLPEDIAAAVSFLCSKGAGYVNGVILDVNGGQYMA